MNEDLRLPPEALYTACDPDSLELDTTADLPDAEVLLGQQRARDAIRFGVRMRGDGFNVFALGPSGVGKSTAIRQVIETEATVRPAPADWCYVHNFQKPQNPQVLELPSGRGAKLKQHMDQTVDELRTAIPAAFETEQYHAQVSEIETEHKERQSAAFRKLSEEAREQGIALLETPAGFAFAPMDENHEVLAPDKFAKLPEKDQKGLEDAVRQLQERLQALMRQVPVWAREARAKLKILSRDTARFAASHLLDAARETFCDLPTVIEHLDRVQKDIIEHVDDFLPRPDNPLEALGRGRLADPLQRFRVNVLVDNSGQQCAPVVHEDLPSHSNLVGRIEHRAEVGTLVTDFTLIQSGALHRANGGYLILDARKVLLQPLAWESLKRSLMSREIRIEPIERVLSMMSTTSLEPDAIPLDVQVVLFGERRLYYLLCELDPEFADLFKIGADFNDRMPRANGSEKDFARLIGTFARVHGLRPLDKHGVARVIEHSARMAEDAERVSLNLREISDLIREADYWSGESGHEHIDRGDVQKAVDERIARSDRVREHIHEEIRRGTLLIDTDDAIVGQINGLTVMTLGEFAFGSPVRITATTRMGEGEMLDIERETELGGPIHSKGVMILGSFLGARYAIDAPLSMSASLVFEQSYGFVEGDSASLAELCALLSSLAYAPIRQCYAVTGSINQRGQVQPIGGVNEKIEAFFDVCRARGLTGAQGVLIPASNVKHLMLRQDVVAATSEGAFHVAAIETVDQAMSILTGVAAGSRNEEGFFPPDSINGRVEHCLVEFASTRARFRAAAEDEEHPSAPPPAGEQSAGPHRFRRRVDLKPQR